MRVCESVQNERISHDPIPETRQKQEEDHIPARTISQPRADAHESSLSIYPSHALVFDVE